MYSKSYVGNFLLPVIHFEKTRFEIHSLCYSRNDVTVKLNDFCCVASFMKLFNLVLRLAEVHTFCDLSSNGFEKLRCLCLQSNNKLSKSFLLQCSWTFHQCNITSSDVTKFDTVNLVLQYFRSYKSGPIVKKFSFT